MHELTLYYQPTCSYCLKVINYLHSAGIEVSMKNIAERMENRQELLRIGGKTQTPCLVIDGKALYESDDIIAWFKLNWSKVN